MFALMTRSGEGVQRASLISTSGSARGRIELSVLPLQPRLVVVLILYCQRLLRNLEWTEAVHHHGQLVGVLGANARFGTPWMRSVRYAVRMVGDAAELDSLSAHEFARRIVENFIRVHVAVIVWSGNGFGVEIVGARTERADDEPISLKSLVYRRRLVNASDDRLEVVDVECPRIEVAVPADDIQRMVIEDELVCRLLLVKKNGEANQLVL